MGVFDFPQSLQQYVTSSRGTKGNKSASVKPQFTQCFIVVSCFTRQIQALASYIASRVNSNRHLTGWEVGFSAQQWKQYRRSKRLPVTCTKTVLVHSRPLLACSMRRVTCMCLKRYHHYVLIECMLWKLHHSDSEATTITIADLHHLFHAQPGRTPQNMLCTTWCKPTCTSRGMRNNRLGCSMKVPCQCDYMKIACRHSLLWLLHRCKRMCTTSSTQASGGDLVSSGWLGNVVGTWRELLQFPPERARRMIFPLMMSLPKPSWCAKA